MVVNSRETILDILTEVFEKDGYSNITINKYLKLKKDLDPREENFIREIVYGIIENNIYLEFIISKTSKIKINKIHPTIKTILKIGIYQLVFMDRMPHRAAVNETVNLVKKHGHRGTIGFVNGILRNISRDKEKYITIHDKNPVDSISIRYSHPKWLVRKWIEEYGEKFTEELCKANNETPRLNLRVNTLKTSKYDLKQSLLNKGYNVEDGRYADDILIVDNPIRLTNITEYREGLFTIQDESSALVGQIINPLPGSTVIDMCSAPGGKSTHLAQIMKNKGKILSLDIHQHKIKLIKDNAKRLGIDIIESYVEDAEKFNKEFVNMADYVLVDAPCTGFGLIRRKPEIKINRKEEDIKELASIQWTILNNAKEYVKLGGILFYSTCTITKEENTDLIRRFIDINPNFKLVSIKNVINNFEDYNSLDKGCVQLFPHIHHTDGFFYAKLIKER